MALTVTLSVSIKLKRYVMKVKSEMKYVKSTKNTHVYINDSGDAAVPSLYIQKAAFKGSTPDSITVTIEDTDNDS